MKLLRHSMTDLIPVNWIITSLEEITFPIDKWNTATVDLNDDFIYLDINSVNNSTNKITTPKTFKYSEAPSRAQQILKNGDIVFSTVRTYLKNIAQVDLKYNNQIASTGFCVIRPIEPINKKYIFYLTLSNLFLERLNELQRGSSYPAVRNSDVLKQSIPLPPLNEQNRIVDKLDGLLSELEKGKEQLKSVLNQVEDYRETVLQNAFLGKLSEQWRNKNSKLKSGNELLKALNKFREKQYEKELIKLKKKSKKTKLKNPRLIDVIPKEESKLLPELPKGWTWVRLGDICSEVERVTSSERNFSKEFLYLDIGGVDNKKNKIVSHKVYEWGTAPSRAQQIVRVGDILFSTVRTYLKNIALIDNSKYEHQIASTGFTVIRPENGFINSKYVFSYVLSNAFINPLNELQTGSSYPAVRDKDVLNQPVPICSTEEQDFIEEELQKRFSICQNFEQIVSDSLIQSEQLKQSILRKAFEGELVHQSPNDEPARILLERIKRERVQFLEEEKIRKKDIPYILNIDEMPEKLKSILDLIRKSKKPISPFTLWQASEYKDDIDAFYAKLKEYIENGDIVELPRKGKDVFLTAVNTK